MNTVLEKVSPRGDLFKYVLYGTKHKLHFVPSRGSSLSKLGSHLRPHIHRGLAGMFSPDRMKQVRSVLRERG